MSAILEAVRDEIGEAEEQKVAIDERLKQLRAIETLALGLNAEEQFDAARAHIAQTVDEPHPTADDSPEEPDAAKRALDAANPHPERADEPERGEERPDRKPRSVFSDEDLEKAARAVLTAGRATPNAVCTELGTHGAGVYRRLQDLFAQLEGNGAIVPDEPRNGRPTFKLAEAESSPEPDAPAPTTDDAGATLEDRAPIKHQPGLPAEARAAAERVAAATSDSPASDEDLEEEVEDDDLVDDETAEQVVDEIEDYDADGARKRPVGQREFGMPPEWRELGDRIKQLCENESRTTAALAEILDEDPQLVRKVTEKLARLNELERRGWQKEGGTEKPKFRMRPSLADQGVTVKQADRSEDLTVAIRRQLRVNGRQSIAALATQLVRHPRDIAAGVQELLRGGEVQKHAGIPDARYELLEPV